MSKKNLKLKICIKEKSHYWCTQSSIILRGVFMEKRKDKDGGKLGRASYWKSQRENP
jgi:hypothetical protein